MFVYCRSNIVHPQISVQHMTLKLTLHLLHFYVVVEGFTISKIYEEVEITCWVAVYDCLYSTWK